MVMQEKKSKVEQELAAHKQQMRAGSLPVSQGSRKILQERQRHAAKAGQAAAALTASGLLDQVSSHVLHHVHDHHCDHAITVRQDTALCLCGQSSSCVHGGLQNKSMFIQQDYWKEAV